MENEHEEHHERLSPSQKAYRTNPQGFLERLRERAATLFESGYRVEPGEETHRFQVVNSTRKEEIVYQVDALACTCTCPFFAWQEAGEYLGEQAEIIACKHLQGFPTLVRKTRQELYRKGHVTAFCTLSMHWMKHLSALRQQRIRRAQQEEETRRGRVRSTLPPSSARHRATDFHSGGTGWKTSDWRESDWQASDWRESGKEWGTWQA